jgi:glycosyltransferase involved in cell wall biosynthesis
VTRWLCARLSAYVPFVIVCAAEASKRSHIEVGYDPSKLLVIPNGYDFSTLQASPAERELIREECGVGQHMVLIGSLGRFHADKDQENFVNSACLLAARHRQLHFMLVGRGLNWQNRQLVEWINATSYGERFILLGERKDVPQCLAAMDIFCMHSRTEGFPNGLAEAMAMGLACVATDVGDTAMLLADTGVVVPKEDSLALAGGVELLLDMSLSARSDLGIRAKARVKSEFSIAKFREQFEAIYIHVLIKGVS